jgi:hypothetical protein
VFRGVEYCAFSKLKLSFGEAKGLKTKLLEVGIRNLSEKFFYNGGTLSLNFSKIFPGLS